MITHNKIIVVFLITIFLGFFLLIKSFLGWERFLQGKLYPNVYINNINFGKKTKTDIIKFFNKKNQALKKINFLIKIDNQPVASLSAEQINLHYDGQGLAERAYLIGRSSNTLSRYYQKIASIFFNQSFQINSNLNFDQNVLKELINNLEESYNQPAKNALFKFEKGKVVSFAREKKGVKLNSEEFETNFINTVFKISKKPTNQVINITKKIIEPEITLSKANSFGIEELIGEGKSDYTHSISSRIHNIILAASKFNGVLIPPGKIFSFNETVGDISSLTGYQPAYIIKEGKTVLGDGGGVCQVSTTLFRAALNSGLPIIERHPHAYRVSYYENDAKPGMDATVFAPSVDLKIKNDTPAYILIQTEIDKTNHLLYFRLYGKKDGRQAQIAPPSLWDVQPPPEPLYQEDPTLKKGMVKQIDFAAWGGKTSFKYKIIYPNGQTSEKTFFSNFKPWRAVFLVGTAE